MPDLRYKLLAHSDLQSSIPIGIFGHFGMFDGSIATFSLQLARHASGTAEISCRIGNNLLLISSGLTYMNFEDKDHLP